MDRSDHGPQARVSREVAARVVNVLVVVEVDEQERDRETGVLGTGAGRVQALDQGTPVQDPRERIGFARRSASDSATRCSRIRSAIPSATRIAAATMDIGKP